MSRLLPLDMLLAMLPTEDLLTLQRELAGLRGPVANVEDYALEPGAATRMKAQRMHARNEEADDMADRVARAVREAISVTRR